MGSSSESVTPFNLVSGMGAGASPGVDARIVAKYLVGNTRAAARSSRKHVEAVERPSHLRSGSGVVGCCLCGEQ
jgi:hypothetical protein